MPNDSAAVVVPPRAFTVGFIGAGGIAHSHANHLKPIAGVTLVCAADINRTGLGEFAKQHGLERTYGDYQDMLAQESGLDAVCICTPNNLHAGPAIAALQSGRHVLVEKPMALSSAQCSDMNAAAQLSGKHLVVGFQHRFDGRSRLIRRQSDSGVFGRILHVRCQALRRRGIPNWGVFGRKDLQGGGPLIDIGVHVLEMAHACMGSPRPVAATGNIWTYLGNKPSEAACAWNNWDWKSHTVEDLAVGMIRFDTGASLSIEASFAAHIEKDVWNFSLMGEHGGAQWDPIQIYTDRDGYMFNCTPAFVPDQGWDAIWAEKMRHFIAVCRDGAPNQATGEDGLMVQQMLEGIYRSAEHGGEVSI